MHEANLTRFGPKAFDGGPATAESFSAQFRAIDGPGCLRLDDQGITRALIKVNGRTIVDLQETGGQSASEFPLDLAKENRIEVSASGRFRLRITQRTQADLRLQRQGYFGLNSSSMDS